MNLFCVNIGARLTVSDCGRTRCMYYQEGTCIEPQLRALLPSGSPARLSEVARIFTISKAEIEETVHAIKEAQVLRQFCLYAVGKDIHEVTLDDVTKLKRAKASYLEWTGCRTQKPSFESLVYLLEESILPNLF